MGDDTSPDQLSANRRWQLAWALTYPALLFDLLWLVIAGVARRYIAAPAGEVIASSGLAVFIFLVAPWIVRRTVGLNFRDFHLIVINKRGGIETRTINYRQSLSVAWLLVWRLALIAIGAALLAIWMLRLDLSRSFAGSATYPAVIESLVSTLITLLLFYLWLVPAALHKTYSDFVLRLRQMNA